MWSWWSYDLSRGICTSFLEINRQNSQKQMCAFAVSAIRGRSSSRGRANDRERLPWGSRWGVWMSQLANRKFRIDLVQGGCRYESNIYFEDKDIRGRRSRKCSWRSQGGHLESSWILQGASGIHIKIKIWKQGFCLHIACFSLRGKIQCYWIECFYGGFIKNFRLGNKRSRSQQNTIPSQGNIEIGV